MRIVRPYKVNFFQGNIVYWTGPDFDRQIESFLQKLPNIKFLILKSNGLPLKLKDSEVDIIIKYCHKLTKIECNYLSPVLT